MKALCQSQGELKSLQDLEIAFEKVTLPLVPHNSFLMLRSPAPSSLLPYGCA